MPQENESERRIREEVLDALRQLQTTLDVWWERHPTNIRNLNREWAEEIRERILKSLNDGQTMDLGELIQEYDLLKASLNQAKQDIHNLE